MFGAKTLRWPHGSVTMQPRGAMLREVALTAPNGRVTHPLHTAPWVGTLEAEPLDGLLQGLSGEWPCVPFGMPHENLPSNWPKPVGWEDPFAHGYAAHHDWDISLIKGCLEAVISMPEDHYVRRIRRRLTPVKEGIALDLWIDPRCDCRLPIGLHPVFALPDLPQRLLLDVEGATSVIAHPEINASDPSPVLTGGISGSLTQIQGENGGLLDFSQLPRDEHSETRLLVIGGNGRVTLTDQENGHVSVLHYNAAQFPFVMLWVSNRGRAEAPWLNRHLALGIEPVRAAFDLGTGISAHINPLMVLGQQDTAFDLVAGKVFHTSYKITAQ